MSLNKLSANDPALPLVSVLVYNYNYGEYLRECLESVFSQTYPNIEVIFSDNASTDQSWQVATELMQKYPDRMTVIRNRINFGTHANLLNCYLNVRGKYYLYLCSDDALLPGFVECCVKTLEANPQAGFVMVHRSIIDECGTQTEEPPFYNQSCLIPGEEQAAVFMMAAVNPSISQVMYNYKMTLSRDIINGSFNSRWYGLRLFDFNLCMNHAMAYIKEPLMLHRIHGRNDSLLAADNLMEVIGPYVLKYQYADIASSFNMLKVTDRLPAAVEKLSQLSLRYCIRALLKNDEVTAQRYFYLAPTINYEIVNNQTFIKLQDYWQADPTEKADIVRSFHETDDLITRSVSYDPPPGSMPL